MEFFAGVARNRSPWSSSCSPSPAERYGSSRRGGQPLAAQTNAKNGINVTVADANTGLLSASSAYTIPSANATLVGGTEGYGLCVFSVTQNAQSPTVIAKQAPYNGVCTKTVGHVVGGVSPAPQTILASTGQLKDGLAEVLIKAAISVASPAASDYTDTLTFIGTGTF